MLWINISVILNALLVAYIVHLRSGVQETAYTDDNVSPATQDDKIYYLSSKIDEDQGLQITFDANKTFYYQAYFTTKELQDIGFVGLGLHQTLDGVAKFIESSMLDKEGGISMKLFHNDRPISLSDLRPKLQEISLDITLIETYSKYHYNIPLSIELRYESGPQNTGIAFVQEDIDSDLCHLVWRSDCPSRNCFSNNNGHKWHCSPRSIKLLFASGVSFFKWNTKRTAIIFTKNGVATMNSRYQDPGFANIGSWCTLYDEVGSVAPYIAKGLFHIRPGYRYNCTFVPSSNCKYYKSESECRARDNTDTESLSYFVSKRNVENRFKIEFWLQ